MRTLTWCATAALALALSASAADKEARMKITSSAFQANGAIPTKYTCEGSDTSPPLVWSDMPANAKSLVLIVDDPDAPDPAAPQLTWVHWVLYDIRASTKGIDEGAKSLPSGAREGLNDFTRTGYGGPCPPVGRHRYFHNLYAVDAMLGDLGRPTKAKLESAMKGHVIAQAQLIGTYQKK